MASWNPQAAVHLPPEAGSLPRRSTPRLGPWLPGGGGAHIVGAFLFCPSLTVGFNRSPLCLPDTESATFSPLLPHCRGPVPTPPRPRLLGGPTAALGGRCSSRYIKQEAPWGHLSRPLELPHLPPQGTQVTSAQCYRSPAGVRLEEPTPAPRASRATGTETERDGEGRRTRLERKRAECEAGGWRPHSLSKCRLGP